MDRDSLGAVRKERLGQERLVGLPKAGKRVCIVGADSLFSQTEVRPENRRSSPDRNRKVSRILAALRVELVRVGPPRR
jgi:hypothetical protein